MCEYNPSKVDILVDNRKLKSLDFNKNLDKIFCPTVLDLELIVDKNLFDKIENLMTNINKGK